jgi:hypothetical protein
VTRVEELLVLTSAEVTPPEPDAEPMAAAAPRAPGAPIPATAVPAVAVPAAATPQARTP